LSNEIDIKANRNQFVMKPAETAWRDDLIHCGNQVDQQRTPVHL